VAGDGDPEAAVSAHAEALRHAIAAVAAAGRGRPVDEIETALIRELRALRLHMPPEEIHVLALQISDPAWPLKHPHRWRRLTRATTNAAAREAAVADEIDRAVARLADALDSLRRLHQSSISARRTMDGVDYVISIDPWTARRARKLQRIAAPTVITVRPYTANE